MFGRFAAFGARVVGVPRGPDTTVLANLLTPRQPKLFVVGTVLHNPIGTSIGAANARRLVRLADQYGFILVEDDVYGDLPESGSDDVPGAGDRRHRLRQRSRRRGFAAERSLSSGVAHRPDCHRALRK
jgi:DNA-binding transcriptional MocR family regulator